ncbi:hypothetical protein EBT16_13235 [bacterium]|nr:hypothetical protein [bacterium]
MVGPKRLSVAFNPKEQAHPNRPLKKQLKTHFERLASHRNFLLGDSDGGQAGFFPNLPHLNSIELRILTLRPTKWWFFDSCNS